MATDFQMDILPFHRLFTKSDFTIISSDSSTNDKPQTAHENLGRSILITQLS